MNGLPGSPTPGGLQGPGRGRGRRARAKVAMSLLQRRLCTLRRALAAAEVQQRKEIIEQKLSPKLRQELIWLMEKMPHDPRSPRSSCASGKAAQRNARNAGRGIASAWRYTDPARIKASLWTVKTCKGDYLSARLHLCGMVLCTRVTRCQREAMRLRQRLEDLGRAAVSSADTAKWDEGSFREAVETAGNLDDLGLYFRLVLDLRPWVGRRVQSPVLALDQLLELRRRLDTEESEGPWPRLRATWLSWMTKTRRKRWRSQVKSQEEAEHLISSAEAQHFPTCRAASNGTASKATARTAARTARLQRAAQQAEAALARVEQGQQGQQGSKRKR